MISKDEQFAQTAAENRRWLQALIAKPPVGRCGLCGTFGDVFVRATFIGAPAGGILVHSKCLVAFYRRLDETPMLL